MTGYIYCHISPSKKRYIGQTTTSLKERWNNGYGYRESPVFYQAIQKYGWNNFEHLILEKIELEDYSALKDELDKKEIYWIKSYNSITPNGYNVESGGSGLGKRSLTSRISQSKTKLKEKVPSKEELNFYYIEKKMSIEETSKIFQISESSLKNWLDWYEIPIHNFGPQEEKIKGISYELLYDLYINQKLSQQKIADLLNVSESTIGRRLKKYNIPSRKMGRYKKEEEIK